MNAIRVIAVGLLCGVAAFAQDKPKQPKVPVVSDKLRGDFFKAQSEAQQASDVVKQAQENSKTKMDAFQGEVKKAQDACGDYQLSLDKAGELICIEKPKAAEAPAKK